MHGMAEEVDNDPLQESSHMGGEEFLPPLPVLPLAISLAPTPHQYAVNEYPTYPAAVGAGSFESASEHREAYPALPVDPFGLVPSKQPIPQAPSANQRVVAKVFCAFLCSHLIAAAVVLWNVRFT
jgi:hypothetical protein